jgi:(S)-sulfolactate dehydrogenase
VPTIYVTEPTAINTALVKESLVDTPYSLVMGDTAYSYGPFPDCETILIRTGARIDASILDTFPNLASIIRVGTGLDNVDLEFCKAHNIAVFNAPGANAEAVADYVIATVFAVLRKLHVLEPRDVRSWNRFAFVGKNIASQIVGIVGFGHIGRILHDKLYGLGCRIFYVYDPYIKQGASLPKGVQLVSLEQLLQLSTVVSLHLPLTDETKYLINHKNVSLLQPSAVLVNASRGGIVEEAALLDALKKDQLTYIADTVENEPQVNEALLATPNAIITPHIASLTTEAEKAMVRVALENFLHNRPVQL